MASTFLSGDIIHATTDRSGRRALAFGADCSGTMNSGIAVALKKQWPAFAEAFFAHGSTGKMQVGDIFTWRDGELAIYALGIQKGSAKPKFSSFERALKTAIEHAAAEGIHSLLLPRLTGGKSGLDWTRAKKLLTELGTGSATQLVVFEKFVRNTEKPAA